MPWMMLPLLHLLAPAQAGVVAQTSVSTGPAGWVSGLTVPLPGGELLYAHPDGLQSAVVIERLDAGLHPVWTSRADFPKVALDREVGLMKGRSGVGVGVGPDLEAVPGLEMQAGVLVGPRLDLFVSLFDQVELLGVSTSTGYIQRQTIIRTLDPQGTVGMVRSPSGAQVALVALDDEVRSATIYLLDEARAPRGTVRVELPEHHPSSLLGLRRVQLDDLGNVYLIVGENPSTVRVIRVGADRTVSSLSVATTDRLLLDTRLVLRVEQPPAFEQVVQQGRKKPRTERVVPPPVARVALVGLTGPSQERPLNLLHASLDFPAHRAVAPAAYALDDHLVGGGALGHWAFVAGVALPTGDSLIDLQWEGGGDVLPIGGDPMGAELILPSTDSSRVRHGDIGLLDLSPTGELMWTASLESTQSDQLMYAPFTAGNRLWVDGHTASVLHQDIRGLHAAFVLDRVDLQTGAASAPRILTAYADSSAVNRLSVPLTDGSILMVAMGAGLSPNKAILRRLEADVQAID